MANHICTENSEKYGTNNDYHDMLLGDVNKDGMTDISDILTLVDRILGKRTPVFDYINADVNEDLMIDISDVIGIVDIILNKPTNNNIPNPQ